MAVEFEDTGLVMPGVEEEYKEAIEEVGSYAYEVIGGIVIENLHRYLVEYTEEMLNSLVEEGILQVASPGADELWYRVTTQEEREAGE